MLEIDWAQYLPYEGAECVVTRIRSGSDYTFPLHTHREQTEIMIAVEGELFHVINDRRLILRPGSAQFVRESDSHRISAKGTLFINIAFRTRLLHELAGFIGRVLPAELFSLSEEPAEVSLSPHQMKTAQSFAEKLTGKSERQKMYLTEFLLWFFRIYIEGSREGPRLPRRAPEWLRSLLKKIESDPSQPANLQRLHDLSAKSREHLCRTFRRCLGMAPSQYIHSVRMKRIREHLLYSNYSIIDIAYENGYDSLGYFYKIFRKTYGCSPGEYRQKVSRSPYLR